MKHALVLFGLLAFAGCASSPEPDFYTLETAPGTTAPEAVYAIKIERPAIAKYLDRPDMVRQSRGDQLVIANMKNWAEPLDEMIERVLAEDLRQRLPASLVMTEADDIPIEARYVLDTDIQQFNAVGAAEVALRGQFLVTDNQVSGQPVTEPVQITASSGASTHASVVGLSKLLGQMADRIALRLHALEKAHPSVKPAPEPQ